MENQILTNKFCIFVFISELFMGVKLFGMRLCFTAILLFSFCTLQSVTTYPWIPVLDYGLKWDLFKLFCGLLSVVKFLVANIASSYYLFSPTIIFFFSLYNYVLSYETTVKLTLCCSIPACRICRIRKAINRNKVESSSVSLRKHPSFLKMTGYYIWIILFQLYTAQFIFLFWEHS